MSPNPCTISGRAAPSGPGAEILWAWTPRSNPGPPPRSANANGIAAAVLAPLAGSRSLRDIDVHVTVIRGEPHPSEAELQKAVGDRIRLRLHESEQTVKR